jgi:curved DNA-binding protein CbpA
MINHYHTLGVPESASAETIKSAFKALAVQYHPDKHQGDEQMEEQFKTINAAYQILSDPYKKAQFDLQLYHARMAYATEKTRRTQPYHYQTPHFRPRPYYRPQPINHKENNRATIYAFALTFGVALLVMVVRGFYQLYLENKYEALLEDRRAAFVVAKKMFEADSIEQSLLKLSDLTPFKPEEADMRIFQASIMEGLIFTAEGKFDDRDFAEAIRYYELVEQFSAYKPNAMRARLALSYRYTNQPERSVLLLKELIEAKYEVVATLMQIGEIYNEEMARSEEARDYFELARDVAVTEYQSKFGKAYMLVVEQEFIPKNHYYLFENLAELYNQLEQPEKSIGISNWMKRVWTDSTSSYILAGKSHELLNNNSAACREYKKAVSLGFSGTLPLFCP